MLLGYLYGITSGGGWPRRRACTWPSAGSWGTTSTRRRRTTRCCPRRGRASACPCTRRLSPRWCGSASGPAWCGATSSTWTARWSRPMPVLGRPARGRCSLSCRARPGTSRRCGRRSRLDPIPASGPSRRGGAAGAGLGRWPHGGRGGAPVAARGRSGGRAQRGPGAGERLGDQSHRSRRGAGQARGVPYAFYYKAHVGVDGGRARLITALDVTSRARLPTSTCWTGCSRSIEARPGVRWPKWWRIPSTGLRQLRGAGAAGHPGEHPAPQHHERPG